MAKNVYVEEDGNLYTDFGKMVAPVAPAERGRLESIGAAVDQSAAVAEHDRWLDLVRAVGTGLPPDPSLIYSGGDVTDATFDGSNVTWVLADYLANLDVDLADDTYDSAPLGPIRNGVILEGAGGGAFTSQLGGGGVWLRAIEDGGLPVGLWWPLTIVPTPSPANQWIVSWYNDATATPDSAFGDYVDTHLVQVGLGTYLSHVECGFTDKKFFAQCARLSGGNIFTLGGEFHPPIDHVPPGTVGFAQSDSLSVIRGQQDFTLRLARAPQVTYGDVATWEFWTGTGWSPDRGQAIELHDTSSGTLINGSAGFGEVKPGHWVMVAHQMVDTHLDVYNAPAPQGPWTKHARVPINPPVGRLIDNGFVIGWHCKVIGHLAAPAEHSIAMMTSWPKAPGTPITDQNVRRYAPIFTVVPWY